jgi:hypothetical protein
VTATYVCPQAPRLADRVEAVPSRAEAAQRGGELLHRPLRQGAPTRCSRSSSKAVPASASKPAGDDPEPKPLVAHLYDQFGFDALDIGGLAESWRLDPGQPAFVVRQDLEQLKTNVAHATREQLARP